MNYIKQHLSYFLSIGLVVVLLGGGVWAYSGMSPAQVCENGATCNFNEAMSEDGNLGAAVGPFIPFDVVFGGDITVSDDAVFSDDIAVTGDLLVSSGNISFGTVLASSTSNSAETMPVSYLTTYSGLDYTPGLVATTLTLPATSTMTAFVPDAGDCSLFRVRNLDGTAATSTTIAAGAGIDLVENENGDVVIEGGNEAQILFCRELDTDVTAYVDEYIAAD